MMLFMRLFTIATLAFANVLLAYAAIMITRSSCGVWYIDLMACVIALVLTVLVVMGTYCIVAIVRGD